MSLTQPTILTQSFTDFRNIAYTEYVTQSIFGTQSLTLCRVNVRWNHVTWLCKWCMGSGSERVKEWVDWTVGVQWNSSFVRSFVRSFVCSFVGALTVCWLTFSHSQSATARQRTNEVNGRSNGWTQPTTNRQRWVWVSEGKDWKQCNYMKTVCNYTKSL